METPSNPAVRLYTPRAIATHTLIFTPLIGLVLVVTNWWRLGIDRRVWITVLVTFGVLSLLLVVGWTFYPLASIAGFLGGSLGLALGWYVEQRPIYRVHQTAGGKRASPLVFTVIGIIMITAGAAFVLKLLF